MKMSVVVVGDDVEQETVLYEVSLHVGCVKKKKKSKKFWSRIFYVSC